MPRLLFKLVLVITCGFTLIGFIARIWGDTQLPNPLLRGFTQDCDDQPQPCWYGIVPGVTTTSEVKKDLLRSGYTVNSISDAQLYATKLIGGDCQNISILFDSRVKQIHIDLCES